MTRKIFVALLTIVLVISVAISILANCGSTWIVQEPTFGPQLSSDGCTIEGQSVTTTSKSVPTTIHWTVGPPVEVVITDSGQNRSTPSFPFGSNCTRCFPTFNTPEFVDMGNGVTDWRQLTWRQTAPAGGGCSQDLVRGPITHHFGRSCPPSEEECEQEFAWFFNPIDDRCQEEGPAPCLLDPIVCDPGSWNFEWCGCIPYSSPIIVDVDGDGFDLTNASGGVTFNLNNIGGKEKIAWTRSNSDDAWLVLDRNGNGMIDDGTELFGDITPQPEPAAGEKKNGFRALAEYDKNSNGGNANGQIENSDSIFSALRLWVDVNHNGLSEPNELHTLPSQNVAALELDYKSSKKTDASGNQFSFRAKVKGSRAEQLGRWAWDVYLVKSL